MLRVYLTVFVDTGGPSPFDVTLYKDALESSVIPRAVEVDLYDVLWHPTNGAFSAQAKDITARLAHGIKALEGHDDGYGSSRVLLRFTKRYLVACQKHPLAKVRVSS